MEGIKGEFLGSNGDFNAEPLLGKMFLAWWGRRMEDSRWIDYVSRLGANGGTFRSGRSVVARYETRCLVGYIMSRQVHLMTYLICLW